MNTSEKQKEKENQEKNLKEIVSKAMSSGFKQQIALALPKHLNTEKFLRIVITTIRNNEDLQKCDPITILSSVMTSAQLGLDLTGGHAYLIPYKNKGVYECQFQPGYKGLCELATRSGVITHIYPRAVYENDKTEITFGLEDNLIHKPEIYGDRGKLIGVYAIAYFRDGFKQFEFMTKSEVDKIRAVSKAASSPYSPWNTFYDAMGKKTVIKQLCKYLPSSSELREAIELDDLAELGKQRAKIANCITLDGDFEEVINDKKPQSKKLIEKLKSTEIPGAEIKNETDYDKEHIG